MAYNPKSYQVCSDHAAPDPRVIKLDSEVDRLKIVIKNREKAPAYNVGFVDGMAQAQDRIDELEGGSDHAGQLERLKQLEVFVRVLEGELREVRLGS